jgi:hypothetical protein
MKSKSKKINQNAENELKRVNVETKMLADLKTREELEKYFQTERIKKLIANETDKRLKGIVDVSVNENTKYFYSISNAATQMRLGKNEGLDSLKYFSKNLPNANDRERANQYYNQICSDFQKKIDSYSKDIAIGSNIISFKQEVSLEKYNNDSTSIYPVTERYKLVTDSDIYEYLVQKINNKKTELIIVSRCIAFVNYFSNNNFRAFEIDKINNWYKRYVKSLK